MGEISQRLLKENAMSTSNDYMAEAKEEYRKLQEGGGASITEVVEAIFISGYLSGLKRGILDERKKNVVP